MKAEAIGNGVPQANHSGVVDRHAAAQDDSFSIMLQAIFAARSQLSRLPGSVLCSDTLTGTAAEKDSAAGEEGEALEKWFASAFVEPCYDNNMELPVATKEEAPQALMAAPEDPFFALILQQWEQLSPAGRELAGLILNGLLADNSTLPESQNTPQWLAELEMLAGAAISKPDEPDHLMKLVENTLSNFSGDVEALKEVGGHTAAKLSPGVQEELTGKNVAGGMLEQLPQQMVEQLPQLKVEQLPQQLLERLASLARPTEELPILEKQLGDMATPLTADKGLSPQTTALIASYLLEGKSLNELPQSLLYPLREYLEGIELSREGETGDKIRPFEALLNRVESFLKSLLSGGREDAGGLTRQFGNVAVEQQAKEMGLPGEQDSSALLGENDNSRMTVLSGHAEMNTAPRIFSPATPHFQPNEVMSQVMERLALLARPGVQELRMQLHPEHLGNVLVKLRNVRGVLSAEILTQHIAVKELLEGQLDTLRQRFQDMNIQVDEFRVLVGDEEQQKRGETGDPDKKPGINAAIGIKQNDERQRPDVSLKPQRETGIYHVDYLA